MSQKNFHGPYVNGLGQIDLWTDIEPQDMIEVVYNLDDVMFLAVTRGPASEASSAKRIIEGSSLLLQKKRL